MREILAYRQLLQYFFFICLFVSRELADIVLAGMCTEAECLLFTFATADYIRLSCAHFSGYIAALLKELWSSLECGPEDDVLFLPTVWPIEPIDRCSMKVCLATLAILFFLTEK